MRWGEGGGELLYFVCILPYIVDARRREEERGEEHRAARSAQRGRVVRLINPPPADEAGDETLFFFHNANIPSYKSDTSPQSRGCGSL